MGFMDVCKSAGLDFSNGYPEDVDMRSLDPLALVKIVYAIRNLPHDVKEKETVARVDALLDEFQSGDIRDEWMDDAGHLIAQVHAGDYSSRSLKGAAMLQQFNDDFDRYLADAKGIFWGDPREAKGDREAQIAGDLRADIIHGHTIPEFDLMLHALVGACDELSGPDHGGLTLYNNSTFPADLDEIRQFLEQGGIGGLLRKNFTLPADDGQYRTAAMVCADDDPAKKTSSLQTFQAFRYKALKICGQLEDFPKENAGFRDAYQRARQRYLHTMEQEQPGQPGKPWTKLTDANMVSLEVERLQDSVKGIQDIWKKMEREERAESEKMFRHRNSPEYEEMRRCVREVSVFASLNQFDNADFVTKLSDKMDRLSQAAARYAEKEAFKNKRSSMGIERKNSALALLQLTDPNKATEMGKRVTDFRMSKSDSRTKRTFAELVEEEKAQNRASAGRAKKGEQARPNAEKGAAKERGRQKRIPFVDQPLR
ncbi:MAG: hypothetical protein K5696_00610 [Lachnospiraceae bacterium]|nr:hypothetical protein [Lachnospiraceae bacterium]